jgi:hypothetical protein
MSIKNPRDMSGNPRKETKKTNADNVALGSARVGTAGIVATGVPRGKQLR